MCSEVLFLCAISERYVTEVGSAGVPKGVLIACERRAPRLATLPISHRATLRPPTMSSQARTVAPGVSRGRSCVKIVEK